MTWTAEKRIEVNSHPTMGTFVAARIGTRTCGCRWIIGVRLDKSEPIFLAAACGHHREAVQATITYLQEIPPSALPIERMYEDAFDERVKPS